MQDCQTDQTAGTRQKELKEKKCGPWGYAADADCGIQGQLNLIIRYKTYAHGGDTLRI